MVDRHVQVSCRRARQILPFVGEASQSMRPSPTSTVDSHGRFRELQERKTAHLRQRNLRKLEHKNSGSLDRFPPSSPGLPIVFPRKLFFNRNSEQLAKSRAYGTRTFGNVCGHSEFRR